MTWALILLGAVIVALVVLLLWNDVPRRGKTEETEVYDKHTGAGMVIDYQVLGRNRVAISEEDFFNLTRLAMDSHAVIQPRSYVDVARIRDWHEKARQIGASLAKGEIEDAAYQTGEFVSLLGMVRAMWEDEVRERIQADQHEEEDDEPPSRDA